MAGKQEKIIQRFVRSVFPGVGRGYIERTGEKIDEKERN